MHLFGRFFLQIFIWPLFSLHFAENPVELFVKMPKIPKVLDRDVGGGGVNCKMEAVSLRFYDGTEGYFLEQYEVISMRQKRKLLKAVSLTVVSAIAALALLTGCGGDAGGSPTPPASSGNPAPSTPSGGDGGLEPDPDPDPDPGEDRETLVTQDQIDWEYTTNGSGVTLTGYHSKSRSVLKLTGDVNIPETVGDNLTVTAIGENFLYGCKTVTSVKLPETITEIGEYAFGECNALASINFPNGLKKIGAYAFIATNLSSVRIPEGIEAIENWTFGFCKNLQELSLPTTLKTIGECAFKSTALTSVTIPKGVTKIGACAFATETGNTERGPLTSVTLPDTLQEIGAAAFSYTNLTSIDIPDSVTVIEQEAFEFCDKLQEVKLSANSKLQKVEMDAFYGTGVTSINLPTTVTTIGSGAFSNCPSLRSIYIPAGVNRLYENTFNRCDALQTISYGGDKSQLVYLKFSDDVADKKPDWDTKIRDHQSPFATTSLFSLF